MTMNKTKVVKVTFTVTKDPHAWGNPKKYNFLTNIEDLQAGDIVVVDTVNGFVLAEVVEYAEELKEFGETFGNKRPKWVIQKVDVAAHEARLEKEKRLKDVKKLMEVERKKAEEKQIYRILAKENPEMAKLLEEMEALEGEV